MQFQAKPQDFANRSGDAGTHGRPLLAAFATWTMVTAAVRFSPVCSTEARATNSRSTRAIGVGTLFVAVSVLIAFLMLKQRERASAMRVLETKTEELSDRIWELREAEERARSFLEAQGDVIVRRDSAGRISYANDAFCALANRSREA